MMKKILPVVAMALAAFTSNAQELPAASPIGTVKQRIGLTDVEVTYARPSAKGRKVFGQLVEYKKLWRTGANGSTILQFSTDVTLAGQPLSAGKYSVFTIPGEKEWTLILNQSTELWGIDGYDEANDVLRVTLEPRKVPFLETMELAFNQVTMDGAVLQLAWETTAIEIPIVVNTHQKAMDNIERAIEEKPSDARVYRNAASYLNNVDKELPVALGFAERSVQLAPDYWYGHYLYAQLLRKNQREKEAIKSAETALKLGQEDADKKKQPFNYADALKDFMKAKKK